MSGGALVLTYHRIASGRDPQLQCVDPVRFAEQLDVLRTTCAVVPLAELDDDAHGRRVAITFDDGYADNALAAAPLLRDAQMPATFFVPSRILEDASEFWWDRLEHAHLDAGASDVVVVDVAPAGRRLRVDVRSEAGRLRSLKALNRRLRPLALDDVDAAVAAVQKQLGVHSEPRCHAHALLDEGLLRPLASDPLFEVGSHGATHVMLGFRSPAEQREELERSRASLERATGRTVTSLAYPYGIPGSYGEETVRLAREAGYVRAYANTPGRTERRRDRFRRPRHMVYDWGGEDFAARLRQWWAQA